MLFAFVAFIILFASIAVFALKILSPHNKTIILIILAIVLATLLIFKSLTYTITSSIKSLASSVFPQIDLTKEFYKKPALEMIDPAIQLSDWLATSLQVILKLISI
jgi:hypothetical protein